MDRSWRSVGSNLWNVLTRQYVEVILWQWQGKYWWTMTRKMFFNNSLFMSRSKTSRRRSQYCPSYSSSRKASADDFRVWHWIFHRPVYTDQVPEILIRFSSENLTCWGRFWLGFLKGLWLMAPKLQSIKSMVYPESRNRSSRRLRQLASRILCWKFSLASFLWIHVRVDLSLNLWVCSLAAEKQNQPPM